jgi:hypothetical protein
MKVPDHREPGVVRFVTGAPVLSKSWKLKVGLSPTLKLPPVPLPPLTVTFVKV